MTAPASRPDTSALPRVGVVGGSGRMGQRLLQLLQNHPQLRLSAVLQHRSAVSLPAGMQALVTKDVDALAKHADVIVDFSAPAALADVLPACVAHSCAYVLASTALTPAEQVQLQAASKRIAVLQAANLSLGISVLRQLVHDAVARLPDFDVEIAEVHHKHKRDAPSGTALLLGSEAQKARPSLVPLLGRGEHVQGRDVQTLGYSAIRGGDVAGEHTVLLLGDGERLELVHRSHDSFVFARGALSAALWLQRQAPGLYDMQDTLVASAATP